MDKKVLRIGYILCLFLAFFDRIRGSPAISCPNLSGNYYISDSTNVCVFYWCLNGAFVRNINGQLAFSCPSGQGVSRTGTHGRTNICSQSNPSCRGGQPPPFTGTVPPSTTTSQRTTTTTSNTKQIVQILPGFHALFGRLQPYVRSLTECFEDCLASVNCYAFDYDISTGTCWFHDQITACGTVQQKDFVTHYRLLVCPSTYVPQSPTTATTATTGSTTSPATTLPGSTPSTTQPPLTTTTATTTSVNTPVQTTSGTPAMPPYIQTFSGNHLFGGTAVPGMTSAYACVTACFMNISCFGADFDIRSNQCFFFLSLATECSPFVPKFFCTHYRLTNQCPGGSGGAITTATTTATTRLPTSPILPTITPTNASLPAGYLQVAVGQHTLGGVLIMSGVTLQACLDACLMNSFCLSVDYNTADYTCYALNASTYCNPLVPKLSCLHYTRAPCLSGVANGVVEVFSKFQVLGGSQICTGCSIQDCLTMCFVDMQSTCQGVDYDVRDNSCFEHTALTVCNPLVAKDFCTHYTRVICTGQGVAPSAAPSSPGGFPAPTSMFMQVNYMGPSVLPSGWSAYPGMTTTGGLLILGPGVTGDQCITACQADITCRGIDFNSVDGTCYSLNTPQLMCDILLSANNRYNAKKPPVCAYYAGTGGIQVPYPTPFAVAP